MTGIEKAGLVAAAALVLSAAALGIHVPGVEGEPPALTGPALRVDCLAKGNPPAICGDGAKVVGKVVEIAKDGKSLRLEVTRPSLVARGTTSPGSLDTATVRITRQTAYMGKGEIIPISNLDALDIGTTIGVMGGLASDDEIQARCLGEACAKMTRVVRR